MHRRIWIGLHVKAIAVLHAGVEAFDKRMPHLPGPVGVGIKWELDKRIVGPRPEQHQRAGGSVFREDGEINAGAPQRGAKGKWRSSDYTRRRHIGAAGFPLCDASAP